MKATFSAGRFLALLGLGALALSALLAIRPPRVVYVSCNPRALGRDLALLGEVGYRARSIQPVDLFPHTAHVETVVALVRGSRP